MIARTLRRLRLKREIDRALKARRIVRMARAEAARRGIASHWRKSAARTREMFGGAR